MLADVTERKQVTALFCDLSGYTALSEQLDPEETRQLMGRVFGAAADIVARYEGRIEKFIGDAIMAIFGVPVAHEDDPVRALRAALELHDAVARLAPEVHARTGVEIALHSGVNTGLVVTGDMQFGGGTAGPLGDTINLAARLMAAAPSGEIWVGRETRRLAERAFEFESLGEREFKGKAQPIAVARVRSLRSRASDPRGFRAPLVGRQAELGALLGAIESMRDGSPQVFGICGDAGTGKSRLLAELRAQIDGGVQWLEGCARPYSQHMAYAPLIDVLSHTLGIEETHSPAQVRECIVAGVAALLGSLSDDVTVLMLHLYQLEQADGVVVEREAFQQRLLAAMQRLLEALARRGPIVVCLQDLHWADPSTATLLRGLADGLQGSVLLLGNFRPGYEAPPRMRVLELRELSARQTGELLALLLQGDPPATLTRFIAERSDGNPFYVEEVVNALVETQTLVRGDAGWELLRPLAEAEVPTTVRGVIAARIDRLDESRRRVLRHAAVVGREFLQAIVALTSGLSADVAASLTQLQAADLIRARRMEPDLEYIFKHALTQEVAYDGLLKSERQVLHALTAQAIESVLANRLPELVETLAYHYQRGGVTEKALYYLVEAGKKSVGHYALIEATAHFRAAYALLDGVQRTAELRRKLTELLVEWSHVHYYDGTIGEWRGLLEKHLQEAEHCGEPSLLAMYMGWLGHARAFHGDMLESMEILDRALVVANASRDQPTLNYVQTWRTYSLFESLRLGEAIAAARSVVQSDDEARIAPYPYFKSRGGLVWALTFSGQLRSAREVAEQLGAFGRGTGNARSEAIALCRLSWTWLVALDFERAARIAEEGIACAKDPVYRSDNAIVLAIAQMAAFQSDAALATCGTYLPFLHSNQNRWMGDGLSQARAFAGMAHGRLSDGLREFTAGIADGRRRGVLWAAALTEVFLAVGLVSIARRDLMPPLAALPHNPWFVFTQFPFAARRGRTLIDRLRSELPALGLDGLLALLDLADGRLLIHQGRRAGAREALERIRRRLDDWGVERAPATVVALAAEIDRQG